MSHRLRRRYGRAGVDPVGEYAAHQRRMQTYVHRISNGAREYIRNTAIPAGTHAGEWIFWTRPVGGGKGREERALHSAIMRVRHES
jgi:hypothetical protein